MYLSYYDLKRKPFQISADPRFLWLGEKHKEALAILRYGIQDNKGFLLLTGDVGTGKTTLINALLNSLDEQVLVATVPDPALERLDFFKFIAASFGIAEPFESKAEFLLHFRKFLQWAAAEGQRVLLIVDEAQRLSHQVMEEIRLLSNIELQSSKLLNVFFVGQNEFNEVLSEPKNRAIRQRITVNYHIDSLTEPEVEQYIRHRLQVSGSRKAIFAPEAIHQVFLFSGGYPRLINVICDRALLSGYVEDAKVIKARVVRECARELELPRLAGKREKIREAQPAPDTVRPGRAAGPPGTWRQFRLQPVYLGLSVLLVLGGVSYTFQDAAGPVVSRYLNRLLPEKQEAAVLEPDLAPGAETVNTADLTARNSTESGRAAADSSSKQQPAAKEGKKPAMKTREAAAETVPEPLDVLSEAKETAQAPPSPITEVLSAPFSVAAAEGEQTAPLEMKQPEEVYTGAGNLPEQSPASEPDVPELPNAAPDASRLAALPPSKATAEAKAEQAFREAGPRLLEKGSRPWNFTVNFEVDSNELAQQDFTKLDLLASYLRENPGLGVIAIGYTDTSGFYNYNLKISESRANMVKSYLVGKGIEPAKIQTFGKGPANPVASNETDEGRRANRRVEFEMFKYR